MFSIARAATTGALVLALVAVGCATKPGATPDGAFAELQSAYAKADYGAVYDMLSASHRKAFEDETKKKAEQMKDLPPDYKKLLGFDFEELAKMTPREAFIEVMAGIQGSAKLGSALTGKSVSSPSRYAGAKVSASDTKEDAAVLTIEVDGAASTLDLVREEGVWRFSSGVAPQMK